MVLSSLVTLSGVHYYSDDIL